MKFRIYYFYYYPINTSDGIYHWHYTTGTIITISCAGRRSTLLLDQNRAVNRRVLLPTER